MEGMRAPVGLTTAMVGRGREIEILMTSLGEAAAARHVRTVFVRGPAGIGKSRLVQELVDRAGRLEPGPAVYRGRCLAAGRGITYWALGEILRSAFGMALDDPSEAAGDKLRDGVREALTHVGATDDEVRLMTYALAATASLSLPESPLERMEPQEVGEHIARAWPRLVTALAARGPLVLVFEDLHWADDRLMEMLHTLAVRTHGPVLLVATARPDGPAVPALSDRIPGAVTIRLDALSEAESGELIAGLLSGAELPSGLRGQILGRAEGNPLFLEELVGRLIDEGALVREADRWVAVPGAGLAVLPDTVHAVLSARLDWLPPDEKRAIQEASVVGRSFWAEPVARALPQVGVRRLPGRARAEGVSQGAAGVELRRAGRVPVQARADPGRGVREPLQSASRACARGGGGMDDERRGRACRGGGGARCPSLLGRGHRRRRPGVARRARSARRDRRQGVRRAPLRRDGRSAQVRGAACGGAARAGDRARPQPCGPGRGTRGAGRRPRRGPPRRCRALRLPRGDLGAPGRTGGRGRPGPDLHEGGADDPREERRVQRRQGAGAHRRARERGARVRIRPGHSRVAACALGRDRDLVGQRGSRARVARRAGRIALGVASRRTGRVAPGARSVRPGVPLRDPHGARRLRRGGRAQPQHRRLRQDGVAGGMLAGSRRDGDLGERRRRRAGAGARARDARV